MSTELTEESCEISEPRQFPNERDQLDRLLSFMCKNLVERDEPAKLILLAALAGEHVLLVGPPGTAKSELSRRFQRCLKEGRYFERLLTRFSVPEELFGPLSIQKLENDEYCRLTEGYLPSCTVAFLDEIFKANSAILNALLTLLNEREFDNGTHRILTPIVCVIGASNEIPEGSELEALYDRFLIRYDVCPVSDDAFESLLALGEEQQEELSQKPSLLTPEYLDEIRKKSSGIVVSKAVMTFLKAIRKSMSEKKLYVSDRRWVKIIKLLKTAAYTEGRHEVSLADCWLATHCLWDRPEQFETIQELMKSTLSDVLSKEPSRLISITESMEKKLEEELEERENIVNEKGQVLYYDKSHNIVTEPYEPVQKTNIDNMPLYQGPKEIKERMNKVEFTYIELWSEHFSFKPQGQKWINSWTENKDNWIYTKIIRKPVKKQRDFTEEYIKNRSQQIKSVLENIQAFVYAVEAQSGLEYTPFWITKDSFDGVFDHLWKASTKLKPVRDRLMEVLEETQNLPVKTS